MTHIRWLFLLIATALSLAAPADAADVVFPPGSRIGLAPPPGMTASRNFFGFEDPDNRVAITAVALPAEAYGEIEKSTGADALQRQGVTLESREALSLPVGKGFLLIGRQEVESIKLRKWIVVAAMPDLTAVITAQIPDAARNAYPDAAVRAALTSLAVRATVPVEEQLSLVPFKVTELADFRVGGVLAGRAIMLTDAAPDASGPSVDAHMVVAFVPGGPPQTTDRGEFARDVFATIPNLRDVHIISSEPLRIGALPGHQIMAEGKNPNGADITIVQWLRFGGGAFMHLIGVAPTDGWLKAYPRFRAVRDGIEGR